MHLRPMCFFWLPTSKIPHCKLTQRQSPCCHVKINHTTDFMCHQFQGWQRTTSLTHPDNCRTLHLCLEPSHIKTVPRIWKRNTAWVNTELCFCALHQKGLTTWKRGTAPVSTGLDFAVCARRRRLLRDVMMETRSRSRPASNKYML